MKRLQEINTWNLNQEQIDELLETYNDENNIVVSTEILNKIVSTDKIIFDSSWGGYTLNCVLDSWSRNSETGEINYRVKVFSSYEPALSMGGYGAGFSVGFNLSQTDHGEEGLKWRLTVYTDEI